MSSQMVRGVVWNPFPVRHAGPQYNVVWLVIEELVGQPGLVCFFLFILSPPHGLGVPVWHNTEGIPDRDPI